MIIETF